MEFIYCCVRSGHPASKRPHHPSVESHNGGPRSLWLGIYYESNELLKSDIEVGPYIIPVLFNHFHLPCDLFSPAAGAFFAPLVLTLRYVILRVTMILR